MWITFPALPPGPARIKERAMPDDRCFILVEEMRPFVDRWDRGSTSSTPDGPRPIAVVASASDAHSIRDALNHRPRRGGYKSEPEFTYRKLRSYAKSQCLDWLAQVSKQEETLKRQPTWAKQSSGKYVQRDLAYLRDVIDLAGSLYSQEPNVNGVEDKDPRIFPYQDVFDAAEISANTFRKYAIKASVELPARGKKGHRFTLNEIRKTAAEHVEVNPKAASRWDECIKKFEQQLADRSA